MGREWCLFNILNSASRGNISYFYRIATKNRALCIQDIDSCAVGTKTCVHLSNRTEKIVPFAAARIIYQVTHVFEILSNPQVESGRHGVFSESSLPTPDLLGGSIEWVSLPSETFRLQAAEALGKWAYVPVTVTRKTHISLGHYHRKGLTLCGVPLSMATFLGDCNEVQMPIFMVTARKALNETCPICLDNLHGSIFVLKCLHGAHGKCLFLLVVNRQTTTSCPICRQQFPM